MEEYYSPKHGDPVTEALYCLTIADMSDSYGNIEAPTGWFAPVTVQGYSESAEVIMLTAATDPDLARAVAPHDVRGAWIVSTDSQGFVYSERFDSEVEMRTSLDARIAEWVAWEGDHE
jgi:hypothetical protein